MLASVTDPEILRYYQVLQCQREHLVSQFDGYAAKPPLAFNADLMASARQQSLYQASSGVQSHNSANGSTFDQRITAAGYQWSGVGENVYAYAENPFFAHVGLMADWGVPSLDHRANLLNTTRTSRPTAKSASPRVPSSIANFGPLVVTEDFGTPADTGTAYLVGVVYQDANGNGCYDEGEGLAGVTVTPDGTRLLRRYHRHGRLRHPAAHERFGHADDHRFGRRARRATRQDDRLHGRHQREGGLHHRRRRRPPRPPCRS